VAEVGAPVARAVAVVVVGCRTTGADDVARLGLVLGVAMEPEFATVAGVEWAAELDL
jgi:hypothetical protein